MPQWAGGDDPSPWGSQVISALVGGGVVGARMMLDGSGPFPFPPCSDPGW